jgi:ClpP class serine protease
MKRRIFRSASSTSEPMALSPEAFGFLFLLGGGRDNETIGTARVVTIEGPLEQRASWWDGYDAIVERFTEALADEETSSVVLRLDTPGGECAGLFEACRVMRERAEASGKRVVAYVDEGAYSAGYALACVASEIYLPPSGGVGSVGVIATCLDRTEQNAMIGVRVEVVTAGKRKADCHPDVVLTDDAIAVVEERVDGLASLFYAEVATSRGLKEGAVAALEAGCFYGEDAIAAGLADGVLGFDEVIAMLAEDAGGDVSGAMPARGQKEGTAMKIKGQKNAPATTTATETKPAPKAVDLLAEPRVDAFPLASSGAEAEAEESTAEATEEAPETKAAKSKSKKKTKTTIETYESTENENSEDAEEEEGDEEASDEESSEDAEDSGDDEEATTASEDAPAEDTEDDDEEEEGDEEAVAAASNVPATLARTSGDVLKAVREITGETSPSKQAIALRALAKDAKDARSLRASKTKSDAKAKRSEVTAKVDAAVREGRLVPAAREGAIEAGLASPKALDKILKASKPVARRSPLTAKAPSVKGGPATAGADGLTDSDRRVAATLMIDPAALAAHKSTIVHH